MAEAAVKMDERVQGNLMGLKEYLNKISFRFVQPGQKMAQAQRRISGDRALAVQDPRDAIRRDLESARELRGAHVERVKFLSQVFSGVNSPRCHGVLRRRYWHG